MSVEADKASSSSTIVDLLRHAKGPIFSEDMTLLYQAGKEVPAEPAIIQCLASQGIWSEEPLIAMIHKHEFPFMVVLNLENPERYTPTLRRAIEHFYPVVTHIGKYELRQAGQSVNASD
jgi:hypothetical protein